MASSVLALLFPLPILSQDEFGSLQLPARPMILLLDEAVQEDPATAIPIATHAGLKAFELEDVAFYLLELRTV
jgi:hypothetical protein